MRYRSTLRAGVLAASILAAHGLTVVSIHGNLFKPNTVDGLYAKRYLLTSKRKIIATVGRVDMPVELRAVMRYAR